MSSISKNKSLKAALALGGGLVTVGLMAAMMNDDDGQRPVRRRERLGARGGAYADDRARVLSKSLSYRSH